MKTWFNAIPHLYRTYAKEMIVLQTVWVLLGGGAVFTGYWLAHFI
jgi:hypothetical protein